MLSALKLFKESTTEIKNQLNQYPEFRSQKLPKNPGAVVKYEGSTDKRIDLWGLLASQLANSSQLARCTLSEKHCFPLKGKKEEDYKDKKTTGKMYKDTKVLTALPKKSNSVPIKSPVTPDSEGSNALFMASEGSHTHVAYTHAETHKK